MLPVLLQQTPQHKRCRIRTSKGKRAGRRAARSLVSSRSPWPPKTTLAGWWLRATQGSAMTNTAGRDIVLFFKDALQVIARWLAMANPAQSAASHG